MPQLFQDAIQIPSRVEDSDDFHAILPLSIHDAVALVNPDPENDWPSHLPSQLRVATEAVEGFPQPSEVPVCLRATPFVDGEFVDYF